MLTSQDINDYVHGKPGMQEKKGFDRTEAREIGTALSIDWTEYDVEEFAMGLNVELEHGRRFPLTNITNDEPLMTGMIALVHLNAIPDYYSRLAVIKATTTKATYRGVDIIVLSENNGHGTMYACTNNSGRPKTLLSWFATQGEALANERDMIDTSKR